MQCGDEKMMFFWVPGIRTISLGLLAHLFRAEVTGLARKGQSGTGTVRQFQTCQPCDYWGSRGGGLGAVYRR